VLLLLHLRLGGRADRGLVHWRQVMEVNDVASASGTGDDQRLLEAAR
jgi:hypothetical protein